VSGFNIEADGFETVYAGGCGGGTFDVSGTLTLTPSDAEPPAPEPPRWPDATTTGVPHGTALTTVTAPIHGGDTLGGTATRAVYTCRVAGATYTGLRFPQLVQVAAPNVTFRNCSFVGVPDPGGSTALLLIRDDRPANGPVPSATVTRCTFKPTVRPRAGHLFDAIRGSQVRVTACDISRCIDGVHIFGSTQVGDPWAGHVTVEGCWVHDLTVAPDPGQAATGGLSHNDAIQIVGGSSIHVVGNDLGDARMASVMCTPTGRNATSDIVIRNNRIGVSSSGINVNDSRLPGPIEGLVIEGNEFSRQPTPMIGSRRTMDRAAVNGNIWTDGGTPGPTVRNG